MRRNIIWLGLSLLLVAALVLPSCGKEVAPGEQEEEEEEEEEGEVVITILKMGETFNKPTIEEVKVIVSDAYIADSYEYYDAGSKSMATREANPGNVFLFTTVEIENTSKSIRYDEGEKRILASDSEGNVYRGKAYLGENHLVSHIRFEAGSIVSGIVLFEIPEEATGLKIEYWRKSIPEVKLAEWALE